MDSILDSIKKLLGITEDYDAFDQDIIMAINTSISILAQIGVGDEGGFMITGSDETWDDYLKNQNEILHMVKHFIYIRTRLLFDPPTSSILSEVMNKQLDELTFRIHIVVDPKKEETSETN